MNIVLEIGKYALVFLLGAVGIAALYIISSTIKKSVMRRRTPGDSPGVDDESLVLATTCARDETPSDNFTRPLSVDDLHEVRPAYPPLLPASVETNAVKIDWPDDTSRADAPSYSVIRQLSSTEHDVSGDAQSAEASGPEVKVTARPGALLIPPMAIKPPEEPAEDEALDRTTRADAASYAAIQRLASCQHTDGDFHEDVTLKAPEPDFDAVYHAPRRLGDPIHVGDERADWAYDIATRESSYPPEPDKKTAPVTAEREADSGESTDRKSADAPVSDDEVGSPGKKTLPTNSEGWIL